jgi:solute carrier family 13 (sodium-dependent dicarboxylate transporter), member 2/3/5
VTPEPDAGRSVRVPMRRWIGLLAAPLAALVVYRLLPEHYLDGGSGEMVALTDAARATLAAMTWMAIWWLTEAVDLAVTALLPMALFPLTGVASMGETTAPYASPVIFLFFGGFVLALSMQRWKLDRRIALTVLRWVGSRPASIIGGFMLATAALSAFVSNTATAALMLPIGTSVIALASQQQHAGEAAAPGASDRFPTALMLAIAYSASIGGLATIIGTPPNVFLAGFLRNELDLDVTFLDWLRVGLPLVAVLLPLTWLLLTRWIYPLGHSPIPGVATTIREALADLGPLARGERITLAVFVATAAAWVTRPLLVAWSIGGVRPLARLTDAGIAMLAALVLFATPVDLRRRVFTVDWTTAERMPWGVLVLFGGGLSLADAVQRHQVAEFLGAQVHALASWPGFAVVALVTTAMIFLTELTSNTATAATLVPILAALAPGLGIPVLRLVVAATLAASCAFMLPVATPPNAIVFASGRVTLRQMARAGLWLNLLAILPIAAIAYLGLATGP